MSTGGGTNERRNTASPTFTPAALSNVLPPLNHRRNSGMTSRLRASPACAPTHCAIPIARKHFQLPSGSFLSTTSAVPRTCFGSLPGVARWFP